MKVLLAIVVVLGLTLCKKGIDSIAQKKDWTHPIAIAGYLLALLGVLFAYAGFTHTKIGAVETEKQAIFALSGIIALKFLLGFIYIKLRY